LRTREVKQYDSVLQVLAEPGCPICALLKNLQTKLVQQGDVSEFLHLCNAHAWAIAAVRETESAARIFLSLIENRSAQAHHECSICLRLEQEQILRTQEFVAVLGRKPVLEWIAKHGVVCLPHGNRLRADAPTPARNLIDRLLEKRRSELKNALSQLLNDVSHGGSQHGGLLGRVAEYLVAQRGVFLLRSLYSPKD
jgi:hypothetical protein